MMKNRLKKTVPKAVCMAALTVLVFKASANIISLSDTVSGERDFFTLEPGVVFNGGFRYEPCCGDNFTFNGEMWNRWTHDFTDSTSLAELGAADEVVSATVTLQFQTLFDTPFDDAFGVVSSEAFPFGFAQTNRHYTHSINLLSLFSSDAILGSLQTTGTIDMWLGNDTRVYNSELDIVLNSSTQATPVPTPAPLSLMVLGLLLLALRSHHHSEKLWITKRK